LVDECFVSWSPRCGNLLNYKVGLIMAKVNKPTKPALWSSAKSQAKAKFDVYPSAYANAWAAKKYKAMGGTWKTVSTKKAKRKK
jgi:hypothetical protein